MYLIDNHACFDCSNGILAKLEVDNMVGAQTGGSELVASSSGEMMIKEYHFTKREGGEIRKIGIAKFRLIGGGSCEGLIN